MRHTNFALALLAAAALTACGGSDNDAAPAAPAKPKFTSQVNFGDSLSDVGTYRVGTVAALGGGKYTINGDNVAVNANLTGKIWPELTAASFGVAASCAAQTGLDGVASQGFAVQVTNNLTCTNYAQGGSRVTNPVGPGNKLTGSPLGQLTVPLVTQVATHLARNGGKFAGTEVVFVMAGGNDALSLLGGLTAAATAAGNAAGAQTFAANLSTYLTTGATTPATARAAVLAAMGAEAARPGSTSTTLVGVAVQTAATQPGNSAVASAAVYGPLVVKAQTEAGAAGTAAATAYGAANGPALVPQMAQAGAELAALVRTQIVGKGAKYVVVNNLPDLAGTPSGKSQSASSQQLIAGMVQGFNVALRAGIDGLDANVAYVDLYTISVDQVANPSKYGISNAAKPACGANALGTTSLVCNKTNVIVGDVSTYLFADDVHPTPFGSSLIAKATLAQMTARGWF
jgi:outer membrane lipase/esterase